MTKKQKAALLAGVRRTAEQLRRARTVEAARQRDLADAIVQAVDAGLTVREVGEAAGISGARVSRIHRERKARERM